MQTEVQSLSSSSKNQSSNSNSNQVLSETSSRMANTFTQKPLSCFFMFSETLLLSKNLIWKTDYFITVIKNVIKNLI